MNRYMSMLAAVSVASFRPSVAQLVPNFHLVGAATVAGIEASD